MDDGMVVKLVLTMVENWVDCWVKRRGAWLEMMWVQIKVGMKDSWLDRNLDDWRVGK